MDSLIVLKTSFDMISLNKKLIELFLVLLEIYTLKLNESEKEQILLFSVNFMGYFLCDSELTMQI